MYAKNEIKTLLETSQKAVERGLVVLLERQTADERELEMTRHTNGVGFSAFDAEILTSFATQIERKTRNGVALGKCLSEKQLAIARKKILRYAGQLADAANEKAGLSTFLTPAAKQTCVSGGGNIVNPVPVAKVEVGEKTTIEAGILAKVEAIMAEHPEEDWVATKAALAEYEVVYA